MDDAFYMGFDLSTQQIKCIVIDSKLQVVKEEAVDFECDLPHYKTTRGYYAAENASKQVVAPVTMWLEAIDLIFERLKDQNFTFGRVKAISGDAQQHGTVYWNRLASKKLFSLDTKLTLKQQLEDCFAKKCSPIWMDFSTTSQCTSLRCLKHPEFLLETTGSVPTERFGGPQILRVYETDRKAFEETERISLISSFFCSVMLGKFAPIDFNEATGTNLYDYRSKNWSDSICDFISLDLKAKLGEVVPSETVVGNLSHYFVDKFDFNPDCKIAAFTGDNAASLFGNGLKRNDIMITLGSSDCDLFVTDSPVPKPGCHIFGSALNFDDYFTLCCFKNSSLARLRVRDESGFESWEKFDECLENVTKPGNAGFFGIFFFEPESCPPGAVGVVRFDENGNKIDKFPDSAIEGRAILECQVVARLWHAEQSGFVLKPGTTRVLLTGGASKSKSLRQIFANVFQSNVYITETANSAALGSALRSMHALGCIDAADLNDDSAWQLVATPLKDSRDIYLKIKRKYEFELKKLLPN